ncbi:MAG: PAS domain S-box protein [Pseudomonadota bacterium]
MTEKPTYEELERRVKELEKAAFESKQEEERLKESRAVLENIVNGVSMLITYVDCEERYVFVNRAYADWYGVSREELLGERVSDILSSDAYARASGNIKKVLSGQRLSYVNKVVAKDGSKRYVSANYDPHYIGTEIKGFFSTIADITKLKQVENDLLENKNTTRALLNIPNAAAFLLDRNAIFLDSNETMAKRFNTDISGLIGKCLWDILPPDANAIRKSHFETVLRDKTQVRYEDERQGMWNDSVFTPILDENGEVLRVAVFGFDITERKRMEKRLVENNRTLDKKVTERTKELKRLNEHLTYSEERSRSKFASDLHDTVAQSIAMSISKIKGMKESNFLPDLENLSVVQEYLERSIKEIRLLLYQLYPPVIRDFSIDVAIGFLIEKSNEKFHADINYINNIDKFVYMEEAKKIFLYRVVSELIINIIKHSRATKAEIELLRKGNAVLARVEDNGIGFDFAAIDKDDFYGFGLFSLTDRVKIMGGRVTVASAKGKGTKIQVWIPLDEFRTSQQAVPAGRNI